jgi:TorA maturation chaperone TorD
MAKPTIESLEEEGALHAAELGRLRQATYRLFSLTFCYPDADLLERLVTLADRLHADNEGMLRFAFFMYWERLVHALVQLDVNESPDVERDYVRTFMYNSQRAPCLPYESAYIDPEGWVSPWVIAQVEEEYTTVGLAISKRGNELPDHVAVELEFMSFLCGQEAETWESKDEETAIQVLRSQAGFLDRHLLRWTPEWTAQVADSDGGLYPLAARSVHAFLRHDRDLIRILLERFQPVPKVVFDEYQ